MEGLQTTQNNTLRVLINSTVQDVDLKDTLDNILSRHLPLLYDSPIPGKTEVICIIVFSFSLKSISKNVLLLLWFYLFMVCPFPLGNVLCCVIAHSQNS